MRTIAVLNAKGGCGKTTLATNLSAALAWEGYQVALGDMDPQQSSADWGANRPEEYPEVMSLNSADGPIRAPAGTDYLVLDSPAGIHGPELGQLVRRAAPRTIGGGRRTTSPGWRRESRCTPTTCPRPKIGGCARARSPSRPRRRRTTRRRGAGGRSAVLIQIRITPTTSPKVP